MKGRIEDIELLRAIAVLSVIAHHAHGNLINWPIPWLDTLFNRLELWWGVDLFFAISGFVIARDLLPRLQACSDTAQRLRTTLAFWLRRAFRLLPSAWLWLGLILLACISLGQPNAFGSLHANLMATLAGVLQFANFRFADAFFHYEYGASFVYWSLSLEEQFYLLLPLLALLTRRWLPWVLGLLIVVQFFTWRVPLLMVLRTDAIAWGVLLALFSHTALYHRLEPKLLRHRWLACVLLAAIALLMMRVATNDFVMAFWRIGVLALCSAVLVWLASYDRNYLPVTGQLRKILLWVGSRSYAMYLIHIPAFFLTRELWARLHEGAPHALPLLLTASVIIVVTSELNFRWVEDPLRRRGNALAARLARRPVRENQEPGHGLA
ncbi:MAG: O-acetyltransferase OatA [Stenotrophomonas maltophilia]|nr:MAG: O-acetyltransferase OatA [Stenotrophomonas maltophilia]